MDSSVPDPTVALQPDDDWEAVLFAAACAGAQALARQFLEALDAALAAQRPPDWPLAEYRERTVLTRFGPVPVRRRVYRVGGQWRCLLDEALGWAPRQAATPRVRALAVELASYLPYRRVAAVLGELGGGGLSASAVQRLVQAVGHAAAARDRAQREAVYGEGAAPPRGTAAADPLFVEADGVLIALQRAPERRAELKAALAYAGTAPVGRDRHGRVRRALVGKVRYAGLEDAPAFWEGAWLAFGAHYDLDRTRLVLLGGDGAAWIRGGGPPGADGLFQLDPFHLARALRRRLRAAGPAAYAAARAGDAAGLQAHLATARATAATARRRQRLAELEGYLAANADGLVDWRRRVPPAEARARGLGAMEANIDKPYARRFKRRGMSWSRAGAQAMAKVLQLRENGQLRAACAPRAPGPPAPPPGRRASAASTAPPAGHGAAPPFHARFVPRWGPHASRPWVQALCRLLDGPRSPG